MGVHDKRVSDDRKSRAVTRDSRVYVFPSCHAVAELGVQVAGGSKARGCTHYRHSSLATLLLSSNFLTGHVCYLALG